MVVDKIEVGSNYIKGNMQDVLQAICSIGLEDGILGFAKFVGGQIAHQQ